MLKKLNILEIVCILIILKLKKNPCINSKLLHFQDSIDKELLPIYLTPDFAPKHKYQTSFDVRKDWNSSPRSGPKIQFPPDFYVPPHPIAVGK